MSTEHEQKAGELPAKNLKDNEELDNAFLQLEILYKSRCVQAPLGKNVTVREIEKKE